LISECKLRNKNELGARRMKEDKFLGVSMIVLRLVMGTKYSLWSHDYSLFRTYLLT